jgi:hypothetical protein
MSKLIGRRYIIYSPALCLSLCLYSYALVTASLQASKGVIDRNKIGLLAASENSGIALAVLIVASKMAAATIDFILSPNCVMQRILYF